MSVFYRFLHGEKNIVLDVYKIPDAWAVSYEYPARVASEFVPLNGGASLRIWETDRTRLNRWECLKTLKMVLAESGYKSAGQGKELSIKRVGGRRGR